MTNTLGQQLKQIRESQGTSLEEISQRTHIRLVYLKAIEAGDDEAIPSPTQLRGFLRLYAGELGVSVEDLIINEDQPSPEKTTESQDTQTPLTGVPDQPQPTSDSKPLSEKPDQPQSANDSEPLSEKPDQPQSANDSETLYEQKPDPKNGQISKPGSSSKSEPTNNSPQKSEMKPLVPTMPGVSTPLTSDSTDTRKSAIIFVEIGKIFKDRRELLSLSLDDINIAIHLRKHYLEAIETGQFDLLPSRVQAKGMLTNYAEFLNLDVETILLSYANGLQLERIEKQHTVQKSKSAKEFSSAKLRLRNFFSLDLLIITVLFISFAAFVIWGVNRILAVDSPGTAATNLPEVADILLATGSPTPQLTPTLDETALSEDPENNVVAEETPLFTPAASSSPINIVIIPRQRTWVQVIIDSDLAFEGRLIPGNAYDFSGQETVEILTGNAGSLQLYFNDQDLGSPGLIGQVVNLIFTDSGLVLPTPTNTPTITETPEATPTPSVTPSPTPTASDNDG